MADNKQHINSSEILVRLEEFRKFKDITIWSLEKRAGITRNSVNKAINSMKEGKDASIGIEKMANIFANFLELNPIWLLTGEGEMLKPINVAKEEEPAEYKTLAPVKVTTIEGSASIVPISKETQSALVLPMAAMAGHGKEISDDIMQLISEVKLVPHLSFRPQLVISVEGDSMQPLISEGDTVVITPSFPDETVDNKIYVIHTTEGKTLIKRVAVDRRRRLFSLMSENPNYGTIILDENEIIGFYRVIGRISLL